MSCLLSCLALLVVEFTGPIPPDPDRDGDGLSDFQEVHKYGTNPDEADSDGDGIPDADLEERREYTYTIRTVVRVMPPYNKNTLTDDYQDGRVLRETREYGEFEIIHYPLNTCGEAIPANSKWRDEANIMQPWIRPGITTNWNSRMQRDLKAALAKDGIHLDTLDDKGVAQRVSRWIMDNTKSLNMFNGFHVHFPNGKPEVYPGRREHIENDKGDPSWTLQEQFEHEILGRQMFYNRTRGTCTSSAILNATVLRAAGIPTRIIICIPFVDASNPENVRLVREGLTHHRVRHLILGALAPLEHSNASHTFNEVYIGNRWRRLNYHRLGQGTLDGGLFGLISHTHTFNDLSEANLAPTWGGKKVFGHANSYSAVEVSDRFGKHAKIDNPPVDSKQVISRLVVSKVRWLHAKDLPECIDRDGFRRDGSGHLFLQVQKPFSGDSMQAYFAFWSQAEKRFGLLAKDRPAIAALAERGFWIDPPECREFYVRILPEEMKKLDRSVNYELASMDENAWVIESSSFRW